LANLGLFLLVGLPVLSLLQFLGGVDPNLVLAGYAGTILTTLSLGSLSLLNSAYAGRVRGAVFLTYLEAGAYLLITSLGSAPWGGWGGSFTPATWLGGGNPLVAGVRLQTALEAPGATLDDELPAVLRDFVIFHAVVAAACCVHTWRMLRVWNREALLPVQ